MTSQPARPRTQLAAAADGGQSYQSRSLRVHGTVTSGPKAVLGRAVSIELTQEQVSRMLASLAARPEWRETFACLAAELAAISAELDDAATPARRYQLADSLHVGQRLRQALRGPDTRRAPHR
ncbi:MAG TPA: hypothetical protein VGM53_35245 [Streptosporangiaceae bacterium]|jgi:hypothetical protein